MIDLAKEFRLYLGKNETIIFSILGLFGTKIQLQEIVVDIGKIRQVINFADGTAKLYMVGNADNRVKFNHIEFKKHFMASEYLNIYDVLRLANA